jgi:hypothetical protein
MSAFGLGVGGRGTIGTSRTGSQPVVNRRMASMKGTTMNNTPGTSVATVTGI